MHGGPNNSTPKVNSTGRLLLRSNKVAVFDLDYQAALLEVDFRLA